MTIFPELFDQDLLIEQIQVADEITLTLHSMSPTASCPNCGTISKRVQSRYTRTLHPHAQRTIRLQEALSQLGLAAGGQAGTRIGSELGISGSRDTILRLIRRHHLPAPPKSRIIGLDDWAWKRRLR